MFVLCLIIQTECVLSFFFFFFKQKTAYEMKRKIVRGGSWKDAARNLRSDLRQWEFQNEQRSYIGFRNVRSQIGFAKGTQKRQKK